MSHRRPFIPQSWHFRLLPPNAKPPEGGFTVQA
jgi:hypothetical protein